MSSNTYAIIGSNCFTGSHIVDALLDDPNNMVIGISRSPEYSDIFLPYKRRSTAGFRFHQIDLVKQFDQLRQLLDEVKPPIVINVAALSEVGLSNERPVEYFDINTTGVVRLCNYLRTCSYLEQYIHISSAEILGSCPKPTKEDALFNPSTPYAISKAATDMYLKTMISNFSFPAKMIRSTNVYGKHQQLFKIIPRAIIYMKLGKTIELHGGGRGIKSFIHIRDVVQGLLLALERGQPGAYHFSVPSDQTVIDIVRQICTWMGYDFQNTSSVVGERLGQDARYWLDCTKAKEGLGWKAEVSFEDGVREVIEWIEKNWDEIKNQPLEYQHKS